MIYKSLTKKTPKKCLKNKTINVLFELFCVATSDINPLK